MHTILKAWYGKRSRLIINFEDEFKKAVKEAAHKLDPMNDLSIMGTDWDVDIITDKLWDIIDGVESY